MARKTLTAAAVKKFRPPKTGRVEHWDAIVPGLGLRITENGGRSWILMTRYRGKLVRVTLGHSPGISLGAARDLAREHLEAVASGKDPRSIRRPELPDDRSFAKVAADFIERHAKQNRTWAETKRIVNKELVPAWKGRQLAEVTRRDIIALLDKIIDRGTPYMANRVLATVKKLFSWAVERDLIEADPCAKLKPPGKEEKRERVYSDDEIRRLWKACESLDPPIYGFFMKVLLVTAQRRGEVSKMRRDTLDFSGRLWTISASDTKAGRSHEVPLSQTAIDLIKAVPDTGSLLFTTRQPKKAIRGFSKLTTEIRKQSGVADFRIHDLRRTAATNMARLGIAKLTISRILNHAEGGVTDIYARYSYLDEKRAALDLWAERLQAILKTESDSEAAAA
jgi:integrase